MIPSNPRHNPRLPNVAVEGSGPHILHVWRRNCGCSDSWRNNGFLLLSNTIASLIQEKGKTIMETTSTLVCDNLEGFVKRVLPPQVYTDYESRRNAAHADFKNNRDALYVAYEANLAPLYVAYESSRSAMRADYEAQRSALYADYQARRLAALYANYQSYCSALYTTYESCRDALEADYEEKRDALYEGFLTKRAPLCTNHRGYCDVLSADYKATLATLISSALLNHCGGQNERA